MRILIRRIRMNRQNALRHASKTGSKEVGRLTNDPTVRYDEYECDHCGHEFSKRAMQADHGLARKVEKHLREEHPEVLERPEYENEDVFREWAEAVDRNVEEPRELEWERGEPLVVRLGERKLVKLHPGGEITLEAWDALGGSNDSHEVRLEGEDRLTVRTDRGNRYVSGTAFPVK